MSKFSIKTVGGDEITIEIASSVFRVDASRGSNFHSLRDNHRGPDEVWSLIPVDSADRFRTWLSDQADRTALSETASLVVCEIDARQHSYGEIADDAQDLTARLLRAHLAQQALDADPRRTVAASEPESVVGVDGLNRYLYHGDRVSFVPEHDGVRVNGKVVASNGTLYYQKHFEILRDDGVSGGGALDDNRRQHAWLVDEPTRQTIRKV